MTTLTAPPVPALAEAARPSAGLRLRRYALIALPVLGGLGVTIGAFADPAAGVSGTRMYAAYAEHTDALQVKSLAYHWGYAFWIGTAFVVASMVRGRGVWLANVAGALAFAGMTTLPGLLFGDWVDSAVGQLYGVDGVERVHERMEAVSWGMPIFQLPGIVGLLLALPLAALALNRAGVVRWWAPVACLGAIVAFMASMATPVGSVVATAFLAVFAYAIARGTRTTA
jgi:hypothetical protein